jgi:hypothetical protein
MDIRRKSKNARTIEIIKILTLSYEELNSYFNLFIEARDSETENRISPLRYNAVA